MLLVAGYQMSSYAVAAGGWASRRQAKNVRLRRHSKILQIELRADSFGKPTYFVFHAVLPQCSLDLLVNGPDRRGFLGLEFQEGKSRGQVEHGRYFAGLQIKRLQIVPLKADPPQRLYADGRRRRLDMLMLVGILL